MNTIALNIASEYMKTLVFGTPRKEGEGIIAQRRVKISRGHTWSNEEVEDLIAIWPYHHRLMVKVTHTNYAVDKTMEAIGFQFAVSQCCRLHKCLCS